MATKHSKTKTGPSRNRTSETTPAVPSEPQSARKSNSPRRAFLSEAMKGAIDAERDQLLQAYGLLKCLNEVLLYADDEDSLQHADVAKLAAKLVDESVERLDPVQLRKTVEKKDADGERDTDEDHEYPDPDDFHKRDIGGVKEPYVGYLC